MLVLYAEDDYIARSLFEVIIQNEPRIDLYQVDDGAKAWDVLNRGLNPDLCVFDINMPELTGIELVQRMRADGRFEHIHVILMTAMKDRTTVMSAVQSNITSYLIKPVDDRQVLQQLRGFLEFLPEPLGVNWLIEPRNFIRRQFMGVQTYKAIFETFFDDLERIMTLLTRRMDGSNVNLLISCVNKISEICVHIGANRLPQVCAEARKFMASEDPAVHLEGVRVLDAEVSQMLKMKPKVLAYLRLLRDKDVLE